MALNSSGPLSIGGSTTGQSCNLELGRAAGATTSLNDSAMRTMAGVPSGPISLSQFYGKSAAGGVAYTNLTNATFYGAKGSSAFTEVLNFNTDLTITMSGGAVNTPSVTTVGTPTGAGAGTGRYIRVTATTGTFTLGTTGTWLQLNATRSFTRSTTSGGVTTVTFTVETSNDGVTVLNTWTGCQLQADGT